MNKGRIYLITRGDDCGSSTSANKAIIDAYKNGILRNVSFMVPCPAFKESIALFSQEKGLCCGLHATINAEWDSVKWGPVLPAEKVPSLVDKHGYFFQTTQALCANKPRLDEIMDELQAQLNKARELGLDIRYADMHMSFGYVTEHFGEAFDNWCTSEGIINGIKGFSSFPRDMSEIDPVKKLIDRLSTAEPGLYLLVGHPAYDNVEMRSLGHLGYPGQKVASDREWQRKIFTDFRIFELVKRNDVVPVRYDEAVQLISGKGMTD